MMKRPVRFTLLSLAAAAGLGMAFKEDSPRFSTLPVDGESPGAVVPGAIKTKARKAIEEELVKGRAKKSSFLARLFSGGLVSRNPIPRYVGARVGVADRYASDGVHIPWRAVIRMAGQQHLAYKGLYDPETDTYKAMDLPESISASELGSGLREAEGVQKLRVWLRSSEGREVTAQALKRGRRHVAKNRIDALDSPDLWEYVEHRKGNVTAFARFRFDRNSGLLIEIRGDSVGGYGLRPDMRVSYQLFRDLYSEDV
ncbi:MAG: hypothetical protein AAF514_20255 [Verrucomicrobiota bacterium]